ncbi:MAG: MG2 domain-containing protein [Chloroherpetonaceae bacterium]|nr:MG2 domain-containing protein [Chloroherpetonaceae bacterium]
MLKLMRYFALGLWLIGFAASACKKGDDFAPFEAGQLGALTTEEKPALATNETLSILSATPMGELESYSDALTIAVTFNQPMVEVSDETQSESLQGLLKIEPTVKGTYRWLGSRTLIFTPSDSLPLATTFKVIVPKGTKALSGKALNEDYTFEFMTLRPRIVQIAPIEQVGLQDEIIVKFNQPVTAEIGGKLALQNSSGAEVKFTVRPVSFDELQKKQEMFRKSQQHSEAYLLSTSKPSELLFLKPAALQVGETYKLLFKKSSVETQTFSFETFRKFEFVGEREQRIAPSDDIVLQFSNPVFRSELMQRLSFSSKVDSAYLRLDPAEEDYASTLHYLQLGFKPATTERITISKNLTDRFGNTLPNDVVVTVKVGDYPERVVMPTGYLTIEHDMPFLEVRAMNTARATLKLAALTPEEVMTVYPYGFYETQEEKLPFGLRTVSIVFKNRKNQLSVEPVDLRTVLEGKSSGFVFAQLESAPYDETTQSYQAIYQRALIQVTPFAVSAKHSKDGSLVMVTRLKDASPVAGASVRAFTRNRSLLWSGMTNADGVAIVPELREAPTYFFVEHNGEVGYSESSFSEGIEPYRFELYERQYEYEEDAVASSETLHGVIFTERGLYRAGETVYFKGTLREYRNSKWQLPRRRSYYLLVKNSRDETLLRRKITLNDFGSFADSIKIATAAPLGYYNIWLKEDEGDDFYPSVANASFRVEAYRPATFSVKVLPDQQSVLNGSELRATIEARYLFGAPMTGDKVSWSIQRSPLDFITFEGYDGYTFGKVRQYGEPTEDETNYLLASGSGVIDNLGQYKFSQKIDLKLTQPAVLTLEGTVTSPARQAISERVSLRFHPAEFYIGLKPKSLFARENEPLGLDVVTLSPEGKPRSEKVTVELVHRQWVSVRRLGVGGRLEWSSEPVDSLVFKQDLTTKENEPLALSLPIRAAGFYRIRATGKDAKGNLALSETYLFATGSSYAAWERRDDDRIEIRLDKKTYKPGEIATLFIQSPYETATALLTIEREGVLSYRQFELKSTAPSVQIPIKPEYLPNAFVSVMLLRGRTALPGKFKEGDLGKPSFKIGYAKMSVDASSKRLSIELKPNKKEYRVGETVEIELLTKDAQGQGVRAEVALAAVDVGVLSLIGYKFPNMFERFYAARPLSVQTSINVVHLIDQRNYGEKGETRGGDKGGDGTGGFLFRKDFRATPYWNPTILTDASGQAKVSFKLPDNLTTFRLMAAAQTIDQFGNAQTEILTTQPLALTAALPRFVRIGDKFEAGVVITNNTDQKTAVTLSAAVQGLKFVGDGKEKLTLEPRSSKEVRFRYEAEVEGTATFGFTAESDAGYRDALKISIPVQTPYTKETLALIGSTEGAQTEIVKIPKAVYPNVGEVSVQAASTALVGLREAVQYVFDYPYGCLEQRASSILPYIVANDLIETLGLKTKADTAQGGFRAVVEKTLADFEKYRVPSGGFDYWPQPWRASDYVSVYATYTMTLAKLKGFAVSSNLHQHSIEYLRRILRKSNDAYFGYYATSSLKAFALYTLALNGEFDNSAAEKLYSERATLPLEAKAYLLRAMVLQGAPKLASLSGTGTTTNRFQARIAELSREMINLAKIQNATVHFEDGSKNDWIWTFNSPVKITAVVLQALLEAEQGKDLAEKVVAWLLQSQRKGRWETTQENIFVLQALNTYFRKYEGDVPDFRAKVTLAAQTLLEESFKGRSLKAKVATESLDKFAKGDALSLTVSKEGQGKLYYGVRLSYYPTYALKPKDNGIAIFKKIEPLSREKRNKGEVGAGDIVKITLQIAVPEELHYVAVNDPLAAGLEAINPTLNTSPRLPQESSYTEEESEAAPDAPLYSFDFIELRDDRVTLFAERLRAGIHTYTYYARATTYGSFVMPPSYGEEMYAPEVYGRTGTSRLKVVAK